MLSSRTRGNGQKLKHRRFPVTIRTVFTLKVTDHWGTLPREVVESLSLELFRGCMDMFLTNQL